MTLSGARWGLLLCLATCLTAQELQPRAYIPTPVGVNFFGTSYSNNRGGLLFDPSLPVEDARVDANIVTFAFGQTLGVLGRTAQVLAVVPYVEANLEGLVSGASQNLYRSGLGDITVRYSMNIHGAPAMHPKEYAHYVQKTIVGASLTVITPTGQYDANKLINIGSNRYGFKPEVGVSRAIGKWTIEGAAGVWLYTANDRFYPSAIRTQTPLGSLQAHFLRLLPHRSWLAADATFFTGGRSQIAGRANNDYLGNARLGASFGIAITPRQAIKISYFDGLVTRLGADIQSIGVSYNVIWLRGR
jgi:Putative MetA-pathway of phenol degradation